MAARYKSIIFSSAAITACRVSTSWPRGGRPASGSGPVNTSEDRQPAAPRSKGSAAAEANGFTCADISTAFNGKDGTQASGNLLVGDYTHPSASGNEVIADTLARLGYKPLVP